MFAIFPEESPIRTGKIEPQLTTIANFTSTVLDAPLLHGLRLVFSSGLSEVDYCVLNIFRAQIGAVRSLTVRRRRRGVRSPVFWQNGTFIHRGKEHYQNYCIISTGN
jgi:hypothetical protein